MNKKTTVGIGVAVFGVAGLIGCASTVSDSAAAKQAAEVMKASLDRKSVV